MELARKHVPNATPPRRPVICIRFAWSVRTGATVPHGITARHPSPIAPDLYALRLAQPHCPGLYALRLAQPRCPRFICASLGPAPSPRFICASLGPAPLPRFISASVSPARLPRFICASLGPAPLGALEAMQAASLPCERLSGADVNEALACLSPDFVAGTATELAYPGTDRSRARCFPNNVDT